ncbi:MAG: hypothetical protein JXR70_09355 [Spirochaetales bacterium]|nr:hypothetical protein [Spirochaetales bacterium]
MKNIIISAHGGRWFDEKNNLIIPENSEVIFYVNDGEILSNQDGYAILDNLQKGNEPGGNVAQIISAGYSTYNYSCWYAPEFAADCGIFEVGTGKKLNDLSQYSENNPLKLKQILADYPGRKIFWDCCREVTKRGAAKTLINTPEAFLSSKKNN